MWGWNPQIVRSWPDPKLDAQLTEPPRCPYPFTLNIIFSNACLQSWPVCVCVCVCVCVWERERERERDLVYNQLLPDFSILMSNRYINHKLLTIVFLLSIFMYLNSTTIHLSCLVLKLLNLLFFSDFICFSASFTIFMAKTIPQIHPVLASSSYLFFLCVGIWATIVFGC